jgi:hypothetical protein
VYCRDREQGKKKDRLEKMILCRKLRQSVPEQYLDQTI